MLIDYFSVEKLPWFIVWIDWNFYAYSHSLFVLCLIFICHYWTVNIHHSFSGLGLSLFIGFCSWNVWCAIRYGYAVG
jgi:hypothetical protein